MKFAVPGVVSAVAGAALGALVVFVVTLGVQQNSRPELDKGNPSSSLLNNVEYGSR